MTGALESIVIEIVLFFAILGTPVVMHELGHFITARLARVRVLEFGIGFPPRAKIATSKGETLYTLNWLPIGGFVKLEGEDGDRSGDPRAFSAQSLPVRLLILVSGVVMNVVLAFAIFAGIVWLASPLAGIRFRGRARFAGRPAGLAPVHDRRHRRSALPADGRPRDHPGPARARRRHGRPHHRQPRRARRDVTDTLRDQAAIAAGRGPSGSSATPSRSRPISMAPRRPMTWELPRRSARITRSAGWA